MIDEKSIMEYHDTGAPVAVHLGKIVGSDMYSDVTFVVGSTETKIPAHRSILASRSPVFEAMLYNFSDAKSESKQLSIRVKDIEPNIFMVMLRCIYTDKPQLDHDTILGASYAAKKYQIESLRSACIRFTKRGVSVSSACALFEKSPELALLFIETNAEKVVNTEGFLCLSKNRMIELLRSSKLDIKEVNLFEAVLKWGKRECKRQGLTVNETNLATVLREILPLIRFPIMTTEELSVSVAPSKVLPADQLLQIYSYLGGNRSIRLPFSSAARETHLIKWTLDPRRKTATLMLTDDNCTAVATGTSRHPQAYVFGSVSFKKGKHAWRVRILSLQNQLYIVFGISSNKEYLNPRSAYTNPSFFGWSTSGQVFNGGQDTGIYHDMNIRQDSFIDVLLDCTSRTLTAVNPSTGGRNAISLRQMNEYTPFFFCQQADNSFSCRVLRVGEFGKQ